MLQGRKTHTPGKDGRAALLVNALDGFLSHVDLDLFITLFLFGSLLTGIAYMTFQVYNLIMIGLRAIGRAGSVNLMGGGFPR